jgi:SAM-dependent methyltransferase
MIPHVQKDLESFDLQCRRGGILDDRKTLLEARKLANIRDVALPEDADPVEPRGANRVQMLFNALAGLAIQIEGALDVVDRQAGAQGNALRRDDVTQLLALSALDFDIALGDQALEVPVDRADRHAQLVGEGGLVHVRVAFDLFEQCQFAVGFGGRFHIFKIQSLNYNTDLCKDHFSAYNRAVMENARLFDSAGQTYQQTHIAHWDSVARKRDSWRGWGGWYHRRLAEIYRFLVQPGQRVLEVGSGTGHLLGALQAGRAVGVDFSPETIRRSRAAHPGLEFIQVDAHELSAVQGPFDYVIFSDTVNDLWDVGRAFEQIRRLCLPSTRIIINFYSGLWQFPLTIAQQLNLAAPMLPQNWLTPTDLSGMLGLAGFEVIRSWQEILWPLPLGGLANKFLVRFWPFNEFALANFIVARLQPEPAPEEPTVSVIVPARNESGNVKAIFERTPRMGRDMELVFVEGHSRDDTRGAIEREMAAHPLTPSRLLSQTGIGKADAVRLGFAEATGEVLMILDADLTVPPEDLPRFYQALHKGKGEFINGVRLVYPMEKEAMQGLNFIGNKLFSIAFSWMLGQSIKDTLCGTKVLWRADYERIAANRNYFGDFDPFGDYDLIFGAARLNRKIVDLPIRYRERTYGSTNISRWKHGLLLLRMVAFAARKIKFI